MNIQKVNDKIKTIYPEFLKDLEALTKIDRGSKYISGLNQTVAYLRPRLEGLGCQIELQTNPVFGPNLVARKKGNGTARILMLAHMDTVWPEGTCAKRPFKIENNFAYGPGVGDCCQGVLAQYYVLKSLTELGFKDYGEIILLFNPDEEKGSPFSRNLIKQYAKGIDVTFCMESSDNSDEFISSRAGTLNYQLEVFGKAQHAGTAPEKGRNAIAELIFKLQKIQNLQIGNVIPNLGIIKGGMAVNIVADYAMAEFRFRVDRFDVIPRTQKAVEDIVKQCSIEGTRSILHFDPNKNHPPMDKLPGTEKFVELVKQTSVEMGMPLKEKFCGGASDGCFSTEAGTITLDGLNPTSYLYHTVNEKLDLNTVIPRITLLSAVVEQICSDQQYWVCSGK